MERSDAVGGSAPNPDRDPSAPTTKGPGPSILGGFSEVHPHDVGAPPTQPGSRSLTEAEREHLVPSTIHTLAELDAAEQANIEAARRWAFGSDPVIAPEELLTIGGSDEIHRRMFGEVWRHAGQFCAHRTATGVEPHWIPHRLESVFDDARFWHRLGLHSPQQRADRLQQRLLDIQAYEVGNPAHARFLAELYLHLVGVRPDDEEDSDGEPSGANEGADLSALEEALDRATRTIELRKRFGWPG